MAVHANIEGCLSSGQKELPLPAEVLLVLTWWRRSFPLLSYGKHRVGAWTLGGGVWPRVLLSVGIRLALQSEQAGKVWKEKASRTPRPWGSGL